MSRYSIGLATAAKNCTHGDYPAPRAKTLRPYCKLEFMHVPADFFDIDKTLLNALDIGNKVN